MTDKNLEKLRYRLLESPEWPIKYMFKFIVPNSDNRVNKVVDLLPKDNPPTFKHTPNLKYVSITSISLMPSADSIVDITKKVCEIPGVIPL